MRSTSFVRHGGFLLLVVTLLGGLRDAFWFPVFHWRLSLASYQLSDWQKLLLARTTRYQVLDYARGATPSQARFLILRTAEFAYYSQRRYFRHIDPRLMPVYRAGTKEEAHASLVKLGVDFIYVPRYHEPTFYNTQLQYMLASPELATLVKEGGGERLYALRRLPGAVPIVEHVRDTESFIEGPADRGGIVGWDVSPNPDTQGWRPVQSHGLTVTDGLLTLRSSPMTEVVTVNSWLENIDEQAAYILQTTLQGHTHCRVWVIEYMNPNSFAGERGRRFLLWEGVLQGEQREIRAQFLTYQGTESYQVMFEMWGGGDLRIERLAIDRIRLDTPHPGGPLWRMEDIYGTARFQFWRVAF